MAEDAGAVGICEGHDHNVADLQRADIGAGRLDDSDGLVPHRTADLARLHRLVRPEVAAADAGLGDGDHGVSRLDKPGVGDSLDPDVPGAVEEGRAHRALPPFSVERWRRRVLLVGDVLVPGCGAALVVDLEHREVRHEPRWRRAMPVMLTGLEEDAVTGSDQLDGAAAALAKAHALGNPDRLPVRMRVPGGTCAGREVDATRA